jgi:hypothetical protein
VAGERDPDALLALCDVQIRRTKAERVKETLRGSWSDEHVFALEQALQSWDHYQRLIAECDRRIEAILPPCDPTHPALSGLAQRGGANAPDITKLREIRCAAVEISRSCRRTPTTACCSSSGKLARTYASGPPRITSPPGPGLRQRVCDRPLTGLAANSHYRAICTWACGASSPSWGKTLSAITARTASMIRSLQCFVAWNRLHGNRAIIRS